MYYLYGVFENNKIRLVVTQVEVDDSRYTLLANSQDQTHCNLIASGMIMGKQQIYPIVNSINEFSGKFLQVH